VDREPSVVGVLGRAHLDRELELVGERGRGLEGLARLGVGRLALAEELGQGLELALQLVEALRRGELALVNLRLAENVLGGLGLRPEIGGRGLLLQTGERAPRGVQIKGSPEAPSGAPRPSPARRGDRRVRS
jgi:hypothetical protein